MNQDEALGYMSAYTVLWRMVFAQLSLLPIPHCSRPSKIGLALEDQCCCLATPNKEFAVLTKAINTSTLEFSLKGHVVIPCEDSNAVEFSLYKLPFIPASIIGLCKDNVLWHTARN